MRPPHAHILLFMNKHAHTLLVLKKDDEGKILDNIDDYNISAVIGINWTCSGSGLGLFLKDFGTTSYSG